MAWAVAPLEATSARIAPGARAPSGRRALVAILRRRGTLELDCSDAGLTDALLLTGWASPEAWGTWTDGHEAALWLPLPGDGRSWRIQLVGQPFVPEKLTPASRRLIVSCDKSLLSDCTIGADRPVPALEITGRASGSLGLVLRLNLPDATSPAASGSGGDQRLLSLGLERIEISRAT